jgi:hypothetical protein
LVTPDEPVLCPPSCCSEVELDRLLKLDELRAEVEELLPSELGLDPILGELALVGNPLPLLEDDKGVFPALEDVRLLPLGDALIPVLPPSGLPLGDALIPVLPLPNVLPLLLLPLLSPAGVKVRPDPLEEVVL